MSRPGLRVRGVEVGQLVDDVTDSFLRAADEMLPALDSALGESVELPLPSASSSAGDTESHDLLWNLVDLVMFSL